MDFVRSHFFMNEPLASWTLFSSIWGKMCSTGQRFIHKEVTSYKIYILVFSLQTFQLSNQNQLLLERLVKAAINHLIREATTNLSVIPKKVD